MKTVRRFGRRIPMTSTMQIRHELRAIKLPTAPDDASAIDGEAAESRPNAVGMPASI